MTNKAIHTIHQAIFPLGLRASAVGKDNYDRVWSRDAVMTGLTGVMVGDQVIIDAFKTSLKSLGRHQTIYGQIPSNVYYNEIEQKELASYGTLSGRVDACTWWIIGACVIAQLDEKFKLEYQPHIYKALEILTIWEMNHKGLLHTPLGGNWADEYLTQGYTFYDNSLRFWAVSLASKVYSDSDLMDQANEIKSLIDTHFNTKTTSTSQMHKIAFDRLRTKSYLYMMSSFDAGGYMTRWDLAANAIAIFLGLNDTGAICNYIDELITKQGHSMLPAFYPIIDQNDLDWDQLSYYYNYEFKNQPYHFHNGGSWPIFLGWLCLGLNMQGRTEHAQKIINQFEVLISQHPKKEFAEYWDTKELKPHGTNQLCFSATGYIMMKMSDFSQINQLLL